MCSRGWLRIVKDGARNLDSAMEGEFGAGARYFCSYLQVYKGCQGVAVGKAVLTLMFVGDTGRGYRCGEGRVPIAVPILL